MDKTFYNPYHFVPVGKRRPEDLKNDLKRNDFRAGDSGAATHERFVPGTLSGRLICKLTTRTPLVLGAKQEHQKGKLGEVTPYAVEGRPAVPGSSLRGLISSLAEAASNSALRVLTGGSYSFRKPFDPKFTLSAIGMIVKAADGTLKLKPVALPTLDRAVDRNGSPLGYFIVPPHFRKIFPRPALKVYIGDQRWIRQDKGYRTSPNELATVDWNVSQLSYNAQGHLDVHPDIHAKSKGPRNPDFFAVSQSVNMSAALRPGLLRLLGCWPEDRIDEIPEGKKHELWLPSPGKDVGLCPIDPVAIERFHELADERTAEKPVLPFHPLDTARNEDPALGAKFRLKPGDLVYFDITAQGVVREIALSSIWRGRVSIDGATGAGAMEFFGAIDKELLPFHQDRDQITIAEQMFGFVEELPKQEPAQKKQTDQGLALAGRIRFSDALLAEGVNGDAVLEDEAVPLRILSSPKPPSPALYFKPAKGPGAWISKVSLKPGDHVPQGRKMYLHHHVKAGTQPWKTRLPGKDLNQKNNVRPVRVGQEFFFHVDFYNLSDAEMGLLLYALAPDGKFHHKLGMGKPLGLGSVKIEVTEWQEVNRQTRYSLAGLKAPRHTSTSPAESGFWTLRDHVINTQLVSREIHKAICMLGDFAAAPPSEQIHAPTLADQTDPESETFRWFVANDGGIKEGDQEILKQQKALQPLPERGKDLPKLVSPEWSQRQRRY